MTTRQLRYLLRQHQPDPDSTVVINAGALEIRDRNGVYVERIPIPYADEDADPAGDLTREAWRSDDPFEPPPLAPEAELWAEEHAGELYRRPTGRVIYRVLADPPERHFDRWGMYAITTRRSSDGRVSLMDYTDLKSMDRVTEIEDSQVALRLGLIP